VLVFPKKMNKKFSCPSEKRKNTRTHKPTTTLTRHTDNGLLRRWTERQLLTAVWRNGGGRASYDSFS